jgi:hypothetical protein
MSTADEAKSPEGSSSPTAPAKPKSTMLTVTPVFLTVLATIFAGMSSSEMTQSMLSRSLATQHQSKAGDEWSFFQAKRIRGTSIEMTQELLQSLAHPGVFDAAGLEATTAEMLQLAERANDQITAGKLRKTREKVANLLADDKFKQQLPYLIGPALPGSDSQSLANKDAQKILDSVVKAIGQRKTEHDTLNDVRHLSVADIDEATRLAEQNADNFDKACGPVADAIKALRDVMKELAAAVKPLQKTHSQKAGDVSPLAQLPALYENLNIAFRAAVLDYDGRRYRKEASFNRSVAEMYEVQVRREGAEADRHRDRSRNFFYSMLVAQAGVTIASLALARTQRNSLWLLAALAGIMALSFSGYVYFVF